MIIGKYVYFKEIGYGTFSKVYLGFVKNNTTFKVAIKKIDRTNLSDQIKDKIYQEIEIMKKINHINIVKCYDIIQTDKYVFFIMEYCDTDLTTLLYNPMSEKKIKYYFKQLISGLQYLYTNGIIHRDIKPKNILLTDNGQTLKIIDFGLSCQEDGTMLDTICGSPLYMSPEIINKLGYTAKSDLWSVGLILYEMVYGKHPFIECKTINQLMCKIDQKNITFNENISKECLNLLTSLLQENPDVRIEWDSVFSHPWLIKKKKKKRKSSSTNYAVLNTDESTEMPKLEMITADFKFEHVPTLEAQEPKIEEQKIEINEPLPMLEMAETLPENIMDNTIIIDNYIPVEKTDIPQHIPEEKTYNLLSYLISFLY